ncbi:MAG: SIMPL domain-containing protein [Rhodospirillales bacterium]
MAASDARTAIGVAGRVAAAGVLAAGVAVGGWLVGDGFATGRGGERTVTVKGVAEREVKADLAIWPMRFVATSNVLAEAQAAVSGHARTIAAFLAAAGIAADEVELRDLAVTDLLAQAYRSGPVESRFIVAQTLVVRTAAVDHVAAASQRIGDLVAAGVVLSSEGAAMQGPFYLFTRLNEIKPPMIAEATESARAGAEQFAADSRSTVGGIRRASQGVFQILARDQAPGLQEATQIHKTVRVVSTIDYRLED